MADLRKEDRAAARSAARLAAIQALYQMDMTAIDLNAVIAEFEQHRLGQEIEGARYRNPEVSFFGELIRGVVKQQRRIDPLIDRHLAQGWRLARIDSILRAILRAGAFEILHRDDVPARVSITEYVDLAHAFFSGEEPKVVNGVLDRIAKDVRPGEFPAQGTDTPSEAETPQPGETVPAQAGDVNKSDR
jgi:transcription antitermination protein NusB